MIPINRPNKVAIIDMGTNTFHLLIAELQKSEFNILVQETIAVKIGKGGISEGFIPDEALNRGLAALMQFRKIVNVNHVDLEEVYATSALRSASNSGEFLKKIASKTGFYPKIIDGKQEAELIYFGVLAAGLKLTDDPALIVDIGGGSVEFIIAGGEKMYWSDSYEIGAQRLKDRFHNSDPISVDELGNLNEFLDKELESLVKLLKKYKPKDLIGVSGTFDTLSEMFTLDHGIKDQQISDAEGRFDIEAFESLRENLTNKTLEEREKIPGLVLYRADMIVVAVALIDWVLKQNKFTNFRISRYSLKEGILYSMVKNKF